MSDAYRGPFEGLTDQGEAISLEAARNRCIDHPDAPSKAGFGYAGGGFGPYLRCQGRREDDEGVCDAVFAKRSANR